MTTIIILLLLLFDYEYWILVSYFTFAALMPLASEFTMWKGISAPMVKSLWVMWNVNIYTLLVPIMGTFDFIQVIL